MKNLQIFWAEDEFDERNVIRSVFQECFSEIDLVFFTTGANLIEALEDAAFLDRLPRLVVVDLNMPDQDGRDVMRRIAASGEMKDLPVILFSGSHNKLDLFYLSFFKAVRFNKPSCFSEYREAVKCMVEQYINKENNVQYKNTFN